MPNVARLPSLLATTAAAALVAGAGCDRQPTASPTPPTTVPPPATAPAATAPTAPKIDPASLKPDEPTPAAPGYAVGRVLGADGKLVSLPGVRIEVQVPGFGADDLKSITETVEAKPDGTYVKKLRPGTYRPPTARIEFPFRDTTYRMPLIPVRPSGGGTESSEGVAQDFAWKLTGPRPGVRADKARPETWVGGSAVLEYHSFRQDLGRVVRPAPAGTKVVVTFTPKGPLADGSDGKPVVVTRLYSPTGTSLTDPVLADIPLAYYEIRGEEQFPDGRRSPLLFMRANGKWDDLALGTFEPDLANSALKQVRVVVTRREQ